MQQRFTFFGRNTAIRLMAVTVLAAIAAGLVPARGDEAAELEVEHGYADSNGVRIHYVTAGEGPLVVMIHGFPDYWYTWRHQIPALAEHYQVVAIDQRGYNKSDKPEGVAQYAMPLLVGDVRAVVEHFERDRATIVGHDWGGAVAWIFALTHPQMTERLVILNTPHPNGLSRELSENTQQQENSEYARTFQQPGAEDALTAEQLASWVEDPDARARYVEAFERSSFTAMLNYYRANYPSGNANSGAAISIPLVNVRCPVLILYGLQDEALLPAGLNDTWDWLDEELTLITFPRAGHFLQQDEPEKVTDRMVWWLQTYESSK